ncbi:MAG TPA: FAD-dependent monooxygenase [Polyangiaceae bacterium]
MQLIGVRRRALILGCGIAGPVLALFLRRIGVSATVYESTDDVRGVQGNGRSLLALSASGIDVLRRLGVLKEALAGGFPNLATVYRNHRGKSLGSTEEARVLIERGALVRSLRAAARIRGISIEYGKSLAQLDVNPTGAIAATFTDGSALEGDLLIGADGIRSRVRELAFPEVSPPVFTGHITSSSVARHPSFASSEAVLSVTFGREGCFIHRAMPNGEVYWLQSFAEPGADVRPVASDSDWRERLLALHCADPAPIADVIACSRAPITRQALYEPPRLPVWYRGPVCLVGDAAHPVTPPFGEGPSLALEDAMTLARCLRDIQCIDTAFSRFESMRRPRIERVRRETRRLMGLGVRVDALGRGVRDLLIPVLLKMGLGSEQAGASEWTTRAA